MFNTGLVSVSFRQLSPAKIIDLTKAAGLSAIEWGSDVHAPPQDTENLQNIARLGEKAGLFCSSYGTYFRLGVNRPEELISYVCAANILGTKTLRLWCGDKPPSVLSPGEKTALLSDCKAAAETAEQNGVMLCLECHHGTYTEDPSAAADLMKAVNSPAFRMYWQPNQFVSTRENIRSAKLLSPFTENIHVFHWKGEKKHPLKQGIEVWRSYLSQFEEKGFLLLEFMPDDRPETLVREADSLKMIMGAKG